MQGAASEQCGWDRDALTAASPLDGCQQHRALHVCLLAKIVPKMTSRTASDGGVKGQVSVLNEAWGSISSESRGNMSSSVMHLFKCPLYVLVTAQVHRTAWSD